MERLRVSQLRGEVDWSPAGLLRATGRRGPLRGDPLGMSGIDDEQLRAVMPTARDDEQEVGP
ncbi:hypothetical protein ACFCZT_18880 [Streptomyces sp. NPDC056230]|uniref:hypothetical protein n=1 Tax=unclassified Streptomyces TaxID=2593676 RepID=UPI0035D85E97